MTPRDLGWIAGFLEGEGSFLLVTGTRCLHVTASQVQREPLDRLMAMLGGTMLLRPREGNSSPIWRWQLAGVAAAGLAMTVYPMMSPRRREQILRCLAVWKSAPARIKWFCKRGHDLRITAGYAWEKRFGRKGRFCRICANARRQGYRRAAAAAAG